MTTSLTPSNVLSTPITPSATDPVSASNMATVLQTYANRDRAIMPQRAVFTTASNWIKPSNAHTVEVIVVGAGGGGAYRSGANGGGGGAGGQIKVIRLPAESLDSSCPITIGAPGAGGLSGSLDGSDGGSSSFHSVNHPISIVALGGGGGGDSAGAGTVSSNGVANTNLCWAGDGGEGGLEGVTEYGGDGTSAYGGPGGAGGPYGIVGGGGLGGVGYGGGGGGCGSTSALYSGGGGGGGGGYPLDGVTGERGYPSGGAGGYHAGSGAPGVVIVTVWRSE